MAKGTAGSRKAEAKLGIAASKVTDALNTLQAELDSPFGPASVAGTTRSDLQYSRNELLVVGRALTTALFTLHRLNGGEE